MIPLTKTYHPDDLAQLPQLDLEGEHAVRAFEYGMALEAYRRWSQGGTYAIADVGGYGSPFPELFRQHYSLTPTVIDPKENVGIEDWGGGAFDVIFCLSVLEHVPDVEATLAALVRHLAPGGLLFLTLDIWNAPPGAPDTAHFHWMREQIFRLASWHATQAWLEASSLQQFGDADWTYHGDHIYGSYSFASLAMVKPEAAEDPR